MKRLFLLAVLLVLCSTTFALTCYGGKEKPVQTCAEGEVCATYLVDKTKQEMRSGCVKKDEACKGLKENVECKTCDKGEECNKDFVFKVDGAEPPKYPTTEPQKDATTTTVIPATSSGVKHPQAVFLVLAAILSAFI